MNKYIDLHMHSLHSDDGDFTPQELVEKCFASGIKIMSITDHNNVLANQEAQSIAQKYNIHYINGIEIDCSYKGIDLHVLGYGINYQHPIFNEIKENILKQELACSSLKIELTQKLGFIIDQNALNHLSDNGVYSGEMFAELLLNDPSYLQHPILEPYRINGARSDNPYVNFYWDYYAQGKPCYTEIKFPSLEEIISIIKEHGGVCVLAHPGNNLKNDFNIIHEMIALGLQGIEVFSNYHDQKTIAYFYDVAQNANLLITCGSDYHGKTKPAIELKETRCNIDQSIIEAQLKKFDLLK